MTALVFLTDTSAASGTDVWHRCAHLQAHRSWCVQLRDKGSWVSHEDSNPTRAQPAKWLLIKTAACSYLWLVLWGTDSFVCTRSFCQLHCAEAFIDTSALSLLLPSLATKAIAHSQADSQEEKVGISGAHTMFAKGCLIPTLSPCLYPSICLFCLSVKPGLSLIFFFSLFSVTKLGVSVFLNMYCLEMQLKTVYTILLPPYIITAIKKLLGILYP